MSQNICPIIDLMQHIFKVQIRIAEQSVFFKNVTYEKVTEKIFKSII